MLAQNRIEGVFLESLTKHGNVDVQRNAEPTSISFNPGEVDKPNAYPVTVRVAQVESVESLFPVANPFSNGAVDINDQSKKRKLSIFYDQLAIEDIKAKYVISCDGAQSWTRSQLGFQMEGEQSEYIWGVIGKSHTLSMD